MNSYIFFQGGEMNAESYGVMVPPVSPYSRDVRLFLDPELVGVFFASDGCGVFSLSTLSNSMSLNLRLL